MITKEADDDRLWMKRALCLARKGVGHTRPNPPVGAVLVRDGKLLGEGWHKRAGELHAEIVALHDCKTDPAGATLYVTMEPCSTFGRTPPCTQAIIAAGIKRVVAGCADPDPRHNSNGFKILREAAVAVQSGVCQNEALELIRPFTKRTLSGLPWVTLKLGLTLDARIADRYGVSKWITGTHARQKVQQIRGMADAMLVGAGTVVADNPSLLCHLAGAGEMMRVVVDSSGRIDPHSQICSDLHADRTIIATTVAAYNGFYNNYPASRVTIWPFEALNGKVPVCEVLKRLATEKNVMHLVCEGGAGIAGALLDEDLVDECYFFYAPVLSGDEQARSAICGKGFELAQMPRFKIVKVRKYGDDVMVQALRDRQLKLEGR